MSHLKGNRLKILIVEDEEDILLVYNDYFSSRGHDIVSTVTADNVLSEFGEKSPDICIIDYRLPGKRNGLDAAIEILNKFPSMPILFITAYELLSKEISEIPALQDKNIAVLIKPVRLDEIQNAMLRLVNENGSK